MAAKIVIVKEKEKQLNLPLIKMEMEYPSMDDPVWKDITIVNKVFYSLYCIFILFLAG
jgi:hypothetical protein